MRITELVALSLVNYRYFRRLPFDRKKKLRVFLTFLKINFVYVLFVKCFRLRLKKTRVMGMTVEGYEYGALCFLYNEIFFRGEYAFQTTTTAPIIIDCGANLGMATLFFKWLYPQAVVHSFEPDPNSFALLEKNITRNDFSSSVHLYNIALSDTEGPLHFYSDPNDRGSARSSLLRERMPLEPITVEGKLLSGYLRPLDVSFLKLDVEGAEFSVFSDLQQNAGFSSIRQMVIEYHHHIAPTGSELAKFLAYLEGNGFEYQIDAKCIPLCAQGQFQDVIIYAYRP